MFGIPTASKFQQKKSTLSDRPPFGVRFEAVHQGSLSVAPDKVNGVERSSPRDSMKAERFGTDKGCDRK